MTDAKQLEQLLRDAYVGKEYTDTNALFDCSGIVCRLAQSILGKNSEYIIFDRQDHSRNEIVLCNQKLGIESSIVVIVIKKKKGETHHYGYGRFASSSTDYTYADFTVTMKEPDIETAVQVAIDDIKQQINNRKNKLDILRQQIETVKTALGIKDKWGIKGWIDSVQENWYKLDL